MKEYEFTVNFGCTYGTFIVDADNIDEAIDDAYKEIGNALVNLPVEVDYDINLVNEPEDDEEE